MLCKTITNSSSSENRNSKAFKQKPASYRRGRWYTNKTASTGLAKALWPRVAGPWLETRRLELGGRELGQDHRCQGRNDNVCWRACLERRACRGRQWRRLAAAAWRWFVVAGTASTWWRMPHRGAAAAPAHVATNGTQSSGRVGRYVNLFSIFSPTNPGCRSIIAWL